MDAKLEEISLQEHYIKMDQKIKMNRPKVKDTYFKITP